MTEAKTNGHSNIHNDDIENKDPNNTDEPQAKSLIIPITSHLQNNQSNNNREDLFIEIFPEELPQIDSNVIIKILREEDTPLSTYADAALLYVQNRKEREGADVLTAATKMETLCSNKNMRVRVLASAGIAHLTQANQYCPPPLSDTKGLLGDDDNGGGDGSTNGNSKHGRGSSSHNKNNAAGKTPQQQAASDQNDELRSTAEDLFNKATNFDQFFPMTWVGKGMLNLSIGRMDAARFFFDTTIKQYGNVLPALLGKAAVHYAEKEYEKAQGFYAKAMQYYPPSIPGAGASIRVGFGMCCYRLGQVDRAKASFKRAYQMDPENVEAMVGCAVLDLASVDDTLIHGSSQNSATASEILKKTENAIKMMSMANYMDHSNAMVQNHLANHCFWKWSQVPVTVSVKQNSNTIIGSQPIPLEAGERVRIGQDFETMIIVEDDELNSLTSNVVFRVKDNWKKPSQTGLKLWKKDYDRVFSLAKGAYSSTAVQEIQAESLFILARVYHVKEDFENANKFYEKACKLAPHLSPARFGLAQTLIWDGEYDESGAHLRLVLGTSSTATDALACLGLLEIKKNRKEALNHLKKAVDLDPLNAELLLLEAFALQHEETDYGHALERYKKATVLMKKQGKEIPHEVWTNIGVLCQETKCFKEAMEYYVKALNTLEKDHVGIINERDDDEEDECLIQLQINNLFWRYEPTKMNIVQPPPEGDSKLTLTTASNSDSLHDAGKLKTGQHIRLGDKFETVITSISDDKTEITIQDEFIPPEESKETGKHDENDMEVDKKEPNELPLFLKRGNKRLKIPSAVTIAFNLARLHEAAGNILAAIELHKAIVKLHPSYVNSYLRLACISRDCSSIQNCAEWLRKACAVDPGNTEVLSLVANLHLSLCDWDPAQKLFNQLVSTKEESVEAYSQLSLGNIYFNNIHTPKKYSKNLFYAADFYRKILQKDNANAYAANGLGTILAEKGELLKAKEVFNRVREVSGDTIPDTLLNLGHIYLAQKKHPEAVQMYQSYMVRTTATGAPVTSKSSEDNEVEVLTYIAFAYFDWAKQTELFNNAKAVDADDRYKKCIDFIETAMKKSKKENVVLRYNWCRAKLQAANCILQKPQRNIRRTASEVQDALGGLEQSLPVVQTLIQWKSEGKRIPIASSTLNDFISHCKDNIESAKSHLSEELKKENEARELREMHRREVEQQQRDRELEIDMKKKIEKLEQAEREKKAMAKMNKVSHLVAGWDRKREEMEASLAKKPKGKKEKELLAPVADDDVEDGVFDNDVEVENTKALFGDDSDDSDDDADPTNQDTSNNASEQKERNDAKVDAKNDVKEADLFGSDDDDSDEELIPEKKRGNEQSVENDETSSKKRRIEEN